MSNRVKLDVDPTIIERNLDFRICNNQYSNECDVDDPLSRLFPSSNSTPNVPFKIVQPKPGFLAKLRTIEGDKVFLNICHCPEIPEPKDISEEKIIEEADSDNPVPLTIPMSLGNLHIETDKSGDLATVYDIAINTNFCAKLKESTILKDSIMPAMMQAIATKHKLELDEETKVVILKNRKSIGTIQTHRVEQRPVREPPKNSIEELSESASLKGNIIEKGPKKMLIEELPLPSSDVTMENKSSTIDHKDDYTKSLKKEIDKIKLIKIPKDGQAEKLIAFIEISALTGEELDLSVGEDRILVTSPRKYQIIDFFLPYNIDRKKVIAKYLINTQKLRIDLPVKY